MLAEKVYVALPGSGNTPVIRSGLRFLVVPGIESFIDRAPAEAVVESIDQDVPAAPPEIVQLVGVPEPDSNDALGARFVVVDGSSRKKKPDGIDAEAWLDPPTLRELTPPDDDNPKVIPSLVATLPCAPANAGNPAKTAKASAALVLSGKPPGGLDRSSRWVGSDADQWQAEASAAHPKREKKRVRFFMRPPHCSGSRGAKTTVRAFRFRPAVPSLADGPTRVGNAYESADSARAPDPA